MKWPTENHPPYEDGFLQQRMEPTTGPWRIAPIIMAPIMAPMKSSH